MDRSLLPVVVYDQQSGMRAGLPVTAGGEAPVRDSWEEWNKREDSPIDLRREPNS